VPFGGNAFIGLGVPDVHYIYIMDTSGSTEDFDGDCGTVLQCMQAFFSNLHEAVEVGGSVELVSFIEFDWDATVVYSLQDPSDPTSLTDIYDPAIKSDGDTCCGCALEKAV